MSAQLVVEKGVEAGKAYTLADRILIGRVSECDIVLSDAQVSRRHAEVRRTNLGWQILDLGSVNGTWVNDKRLAQAQPLEPGDHVRIGTTVFVFKIASDHPDRLKREIEREARRQIRSAAREHLDNQARQRDRADGARPPTPPTSNNLLYVMLGGFGGGILLMAVIFASVVSSRQALELTPTASGIIGSATRTPEPYTPASTIAPTVTALPTQTNTLQPTLTNTATGTATPTATSAPTWTPTVTPSETPTATQTWTPSVTPSSTPTLTGTWTPTATPTAFVVLRAQPDVVNPGGQSMLSWHVENVQAFYLYGGELGAPPGLPVTGPDGTHSVRPSAPFSTYGLYVLRPDGTETRSEVTIRVVDTQPPVISNVIVAPTRINPVSFQSWCNNTSTVAATVTDNSGVSFVRVIYQFQYPRRWTPAGNWITLDMSRLRDATYQTTIRTTSDTSAGQRIILHVEAGDNFNNVARSTDYFIYIVDCPPG